MISDIPRMIMSFAVAVNLSLAAVPFANDPAPTQGGQWKIETIESENSVGAFSSLELDDNDNPHISYFDPSNQLVKHAKWNGTGWEITIVDSVGSSAIGTSLALDENGYPHISYNTGPLSFELRYARWTGVNWIVDTVDSDTNPVGEYSSLALDSKGNPHISYYHAGASDLRYAEWTGAKWDIEIVHSDGEVGKFTSLVLDIDDNPHISYHAVYYGNLMYARRAGNSWHNETVDSHLCTGWESSIALDSTDTPHISYSNCGKPGPMGDNDLKYARWDGTYWRKETAYHRYKAGRSTSLVLDNDDKPHISFYDQSFDKLRYANKTGIDWRVEVIDDSHVLAEGFTSIALDSRDSPHISYYGGEADLKYVSRISLIKNQPPVAYAGPDRTVQVGEIVQFEGTGSTDPDEGWVIDVVDSLGDVGQYTSMALDGSDIPHIVYWNRDNRLLMYAKQRGLVWDFDVIDQVRNPWPSLKLDSMDRPHLCYRNWTGSYDMKYAHWTGTSWSIEIIRSLGTEGGLCSLALDSNDKPHVSYNDPAKEDLLYAKRIGAKWVFETVDSQGGTGFSNSLALDSRDYPHISYSHRDLHLKYANWTGSEWNFESFGTKAYYLFGTSLVLDSEDRPHIASDPRDDLMYANWNGNEWNVEIIDTFGNVGNFNSIAVDSEDQPHISHFDWSHYNLRYATWEDGTWKLKVVDPEHGSGYYTSTVIDSDDRPHISYCDCMLPWGADLKYARKAGGIVSYVWDFGDGSPLVTGVKRTHAFTSPGVYNVTLIVTDDLGGSDSDSCTITVLEGQPPVADAGGPYFASEGEQILFNASGSHDPSGNALHYRWDFDNDSVWDTNWSTEPIASHTWYDDHSGAAALEVATGVQTSKAVVSDGDIVASAWLGSVYSQAQSFVPRMDILEKVHVDVAISALTETPDAPICLHIRESLDSTDLTSVCLPPEGLPRAPPVVPGWVEFDFSDITVQPERTYFMVLTSSTKLWVYETHPSDDLYPDGVLYHNQSGGWYPVQLDLRFKILGTEVGASAIAYADVTVENTPPTADAGGPYNSFEGTPIQFIGNHTDPGPLDTHTYEWDFSYDGTTFIPDATGNPYQKTWYDDHIGNIALRVTDDDGGWDLDVTTVTIVNVPPIANAGDDKEGYEISTFTFNGSFYDPGSGDTHTFEWDFDYDGMTFDTDAAGQSTTHTWTDDFNGLIALRVTDDDGGADIDTAHVLVKNVPPTVTLEVLPIEVDAFLRIAGEKWHDVSIELFEDGVLIANGTLIRYPGSPNDQMLDLSSLQFDYSKNYTATVTYTPEDDPINGQPNGANPCWIILRFSDGQELWIHHTFNVQHPETYLWEVDLTAAILSHGMTFKATASDPGADELTFHWDFGDGTNVTTFYPNGNETYPVEIMEIINHAFPGSGTYTVTVTVEDDDGGVGVAMITIIIP